MRKYDWGGDLVRNIIYDFQINRNRLLNSDTFNTVKSRLSLRNIYKVILTCLRRPLLIQGKLITRVIVKKCEKYLLTKYNCLKQRAVILCSFSRMFKASLTEQCVCTVHEQATTWTSNSVAQLLRLLGSPEVQCRVYKSPPTVLPNLLQFSASRPIHYDLLSSLCLCLGLKLHQAPSRLQINYSYVNTQTSNACCMPHQFHSLNKQQ